LPDAQTFLPLSPQVFQILLSLHEGPQHGYSMIQNIQARTHDEVRLTASTLYDALARLVDQQLIEGVEAPAEAADRDPRRRYYVLTARGREVTQMEARRLQRLLEWASRAVSS
jgi:DNA-binding PadR family transcriptional regulator